MKRLRLILVGLVLMSAAASSWAQFNYKRWYCDTCSLYPIGDPKGAEMPSDVARFIKDQNTAIIATGPTANSQMPRWVPGDTITICDGALCLTSVYSNGVWLPYAPTFRDNGRGYKNAGIGRIYGSPNSFFVARTDFDASLMYFPQLVTRHYTITTCQPGSGCGTVEGVVNYQKVGFASNYDWTGDFNTSDAGGTDYNQTAGYNSHGTSPGGYYGGVGVMNGTAYGSSGLAPGDTVNVGNGGLIPNGIRTVNK